MKEHRREALLKEYGEVGSNFRLLSDIRFKLLAFLPIAAAATAALKGDSIGLGSLVLSLFGLIATLALATYNARNDQLYDELVGRAASLERSLGIPDGYFANRPRPWFTVHVGRMNWKVDHRSSVTAIYAASSTLWLIGVLAPLFDLSRRLYMRAKLPYFETPHATSVVLLFATVFSIACVLWVVKVLRAQRKEQAHTLRTLAAEAVSMAIGLTMQDVASNEALLSLCMLLGGEKAETITARAKYYSQLAPESLTHYVQVGSPQAVAAHTIALLTDLPARWLFDSVTNRRGAL